MSPTWLARTGYAPGQCARERKREREAGLTYRENLQSCRVFRGGRRALRLIATAPANRIPISRFSVWSLASEESTPQSRFLSLPLERCRRTGHTSERRRNSDFYDGQYPYRDRHLSNGTSVETRNVHRRSIRGLACLIDIDGFFPRAPVPLVRPEVVAPSHPRVLLNRAFHLVNRMKSRLSSIRDIIVAEETEAPLRKTKRA